MHFSYQGHYFLGAPILNVSLCFQSLIDTFTPDDKVVNVADGRQANNCSNCEQGGKVAG